MASRRTTEGLVQRRIPNNSAAAATTHEEGHVNGESSQPDVDVDSKDTRLTLMEEVLLLGLKDKEVFIHIFINSVLTTSSHRDTHPFGMIVFRRVFVAVSSSSYLFGEE